MAEGPLFAIHQPESYITGMDSWNTNQHNKSGLVTRMREQGVTESHAEQATLAFLKNYLDKGKSPMCGTSICQDRRFLCRYMPELANFFHYRNLDVSTLKELALRWHPELVKALKKESKHLAMEDIKDSIMELVYYREHFMKLPAQL